MGRKSREKRERRKNQPDKRDSGTPNSVVVTVCILFFLIGLCISAYTVSDLLFWYKMQKNAIKVSGILIKLDVKTSTSGGRGGGGSVTVFAEYTYSVNGKSYTGSRASVHSGGDNIGYFHKNLYNRLKQVQERNTPLTVYVNAMNHSSSCLDIRLNFVRTIIQILFPIPFLFISLMGFYNMIKYRIKGDIAHRLG